MVCQYGENLFPYSFLNAQAQPFFLEHYAALLVDFTFFQCGILSPIPQYLNTIVQYFRIIRGKWKLIDRFVKTSTCVQVSTKTHTGFLEVLYQVVLREMPGAVETHVFHEMCQPLLPIGF